MKKLKFSQGQVHQEMVDYFIKKKVAIAVRGKGTVIPTSVDDLSPRMKKPTRKHTFTGEVTPNKEYVAARNRLHYRAKNVPFPSRPSKVKESPLDYVHTTSREERAKSNNTTISITLPSSMSATDLIDLIAIIRKSGAKCSL